MKTYVFTDILTKETFEVKCAIFQLNSIERTNKELAKWIVGRIVKREEKK